MPTAHRNFPHFFKVFSDPKWFRSWKGDVFRQSAPRWQSRPYRFTGIGSVLMGARWSVQWLMPTIYTSINPDTLHAEAYHRGRRFGWTAADLQAQLIIAMHWELKAVVDLTDSTTLKALGVKKSEILKCDWDAEQKSGNESVTQAIGRAAFEHGAEGLVVPSARHPGGVNIVYYPSNRRDGTVIQAHDEANIPFLHGL